jgi:acetyl esterase/lipase
MMTGTITIAVLLTGGLWAFTRFVLRGENLARYDEPGHVAAREPSDPSAGHYEALELLREFQAPAPGRTSARDRLGALREKLDSLGDRANLDGVDIHPADVDGIPGEWLLAAGADPDRRLLYLHGGAFTMGSRRSHRGITSTLSRLAGAAVLAIDYRLMPEHGRLDCLADCQRAYRWILDNGPQGPAPAKALFVAGDSAGGNLCLVLIAWARDAGLRRADAAVALSPVTDGTLSSPSLVGNLHSDHMLGPMFGRLARVPSGLLLWLAWLANRVRPCDPRVSPAHGRLHGLPPTLIHASEAEMLLDDARRYVNKARAAGCDARLQTWHHMVHVWHAFGASLPEATEAFGRIAEFLESVKPRRSAIAVTVEQPPAPT